MPKEDVLVSILTDFIVEFITNYTIHTKINWLCFFLLLVINLANIAQTAGTVGAPGVGNPSTAQSSSLRIYFDKKYTRWLVLARRVENQADLADLQDKWVA